MNKSIQSPAGTPGIHRKLFWLVAAAILSAPFAANSESAEGDAGKEELESQFTDLRTFVEIPERARQILREDMLDHLAVLNEINRYLAENDLRSAAEAAETGMGRSLLAKYQDQDMRPGRFMPQEMREMGWNLHNAATEFAKAARQGNMRVIMDAYYNLTSMCVTCHYSYRTR